VLLSLVYTIISALLDLAAVRASSARAQTIELLALRHEVRVLRRQALRAYTDHYNAARSHRALWLRPPLGPPSYRPGPGGAVCRRDRLGGLIHEYERAAA
jgi:hypothetical protein